MAKGANSLLMAMGAMDICYETVNDALDNGDLDLSDDDAQDVADGCISAVEKIGFDAADEADFPPYQHGRPAA